MKTINLILALLFLIGCDKQITSENFDVGIDILIFDQHGNDLLDLNDPNFIDLSEVKIFYIINNQILEQYEPNLDCPSKICLVSELGRNSASLFPNHSEKEEFPVTLIKWNNEKTDTVKCHFIRNDGNVTCDKVWYNGVQKFPNDAIPGFQRAFKIIK
jgi:hypothetical protein